MTLKDIVSGVKNVWYWLPIIWSDRQWDHWFLMRIVEHKLRAMEEFFDGSDPRLMTHLARAAEIRYCRILASRITRDEYLENALRYHEEIYGQAEMFWINNELAEVAVPTLYGESREHEKRIRGRLYRQSSRQEDQDYRELFCLMGKHVRGWWD